jgi:8-oxo-dGTP diphosphatase
MPTAAQTRTPRGLRAVARSTTIVTVTARPFRTRLTTLVYALHEGRLLLLRRRKSPNVGLWSPPGGILEPGETPLEGAVRELAEETGLDGTHARLAAVISEVDAARGDAWLMFAIRVDVDTDGPLVASREGAPVWVALGEIEGLPTPPADRHILAAVLDPAPGVGFLRVGFDDGRFVGVTTTRG